MLIVALVGLTAAPLGVALAEDEVPVPPTDVVIETGDAGALSNTGTTENTNTVDTDADQGSDTPEEVVDTTDENQNTAEQVQEEPVVPEDESANAESTNAADELSSTSEADVAADASAEQDVTEQATSTNEEEGENAEVLDLPGDEEGTASSTLQLDNDADANNGVETTASTGGNTASTTNGNASISTGNAFAFANLINVLNTNIIDSYGFLLFLSALFGNGNIDLRGLDFSGAGPILQGQSPCSLEECQGSTFNNLGIDNTASINNSVYVEANTGNNTATGTNGSITTGDAFAGANVVNVANTNIINSNYLLLAVNHIGDYSGDLVLPGLSFFDWFLNGMNGGIASDTSINNTATVNNTVGTTADTGNNAATSTNGNASIETGDAGSSSSVSNVVNTNIMGGGAPVYILLNVTGNWTGEVFGLPPGLLWAHTPSGIVIYSDQEDGGGLAGPGSTVVSNTAEVNNDVQVFALTGNNQVNAKNGASIQTGNAYAATNIFNLINTNIIGRNLMLAVLNIMGDWNGNISFGMPDLFVGGQFESQHNPLVPGSPFTYKILVRNNGDLDATNVQVGHVFDTKLVMMDGDPAWDIGVLKPGEAREVMLTGRIASAMNYGEFASSIETVAMLKEQDGNPNDNTEEIPFTILNNPGRISLVTLGASAPATAPDITVTKNANVTETAAPGNVEYTIIVKNNGGAGYNAELYDTLKNEAGEIINDQAWDLGTINAGESITVTYTMQFTQMTKPGLYTNEAQVFADLSPSTDDEDSSDSYVESNISVSKVRVTSNDGNSILPEACFTYINSYLKYGKKNDTEQVKKLQTFLREKENFGGVRTTGTFDMPTLQGVYAFQQKYADDVLDPWGIDKPTGFVYFTTQKKINEIYCRTSYDLSPEQLAEINKFKSRIERTQSSPTPPTSSPEAGADVGATQDVVPVAAKEPESAIAEATSALSGQSAAAFAGMTDIATSSFASWLRGSLNSLTSRFGGGWGTMRDLFNFRY